MSACSSQNVLEFFWRQYKWQVWLKSAFSCQLCCLSTHAVSDQSMWPDSPTRLASFLSSGTGAKKRAKRKRRVRRRKRKRGRKRRSSWSSPRPLQSLIRRMMWKGDLFFCVFTRRVPCSNGRSRMPCYWLQLMWLLSWQPHLYIFSLEYTTKIFITFMVILLQS